MFAFLINILFLISLYRSKARVNHKLCKKTSQKSVGAQESSKKSPDKDNLIVNWIVKKLLKKAVKSNNKI